MKEREIDMLDVITTMLSHWRSVLIVMIIGAVLLGGLSYVRSYQAIQNAQQMEEKEATQDEVAMEDQLAELERKMDDSQKIAVLTAIDDESEYALKKKYFEESVYMQLDAYNIAQIELVYDLQPGDETQVQRLGAIYEDVINSVGLYDWVEQHTGIAMTYARELISVKTSSSTPFTNGELTGSFGNDSLKITVIQSDDKLCKELADAVKGYVEQQQEKLVPVIGEHKVLLLSELSGRVMSSLLNQQIEYRNTLFALQSAIIAEKTAFTDEQKQYYNILTNKEELEDAEQKTEEVVPMAAEKPQMSKKYVLLGAVLFAFVYAAILAMGYIFNSKLRANDVLQTLYGVPQIGVVVKDTNKKLFLDKWIDNLRYYGKRKFTAEQSMELAFAAVKIAATKNGLNSIGLLGCNLSAGADKVCNALKAALEKEGIEVTVLNNVLYDVEAMEQVDTLKGAVLVEKAGSTLYNEITNELELLKRQEVPVLGGIIVE